MIIGVDAGMLGVTDERLRVGVWRVVTQLLQALRACNDTDAYRLYSFAPIPADLMHRLGFRFENRVLTPTTGWMTLRLPLELRLHPPEVFLGLAQALPNTPGRKIGFIYDLGFLSHPEYYPDSAEKLTNITADTVSRADIIITISHAIAEEITRVYAVPKHKLAVAYPGVGVQFGPKGKSFKGSRPYFLYVGSLKRGKNVAGLIQAFAQFHTHGHQEFDLYLAGSDLWLDPEVEQVMKAHNIQEHVKHLGFVTDDELSLYYRGAVAFVSPSLVEGFCLPAVEAMASGCPVITSDIPVLKEIVGDAGVQIAPRDTEAIAAAMSMMVTNPKLREALATKGLKRARDFRWKKMAEAVYPHL